MNEMEKMILLTASIFILSQSGTSNAFTLQNPLRAHSNIAQLQHLRQKTVSTSSYGHGSVFTTTPSQIPSKHSFQKQSFILKFSTNDKEDRALENDNDDDELSQMKNEIEQMKKEAALRIDALSNKIIPSSPPSSTSVTISNEKNGEEGITDELVSKASEETVSSSFIETKAAENGVTNKENNEVKTAISNAVRAVELENTKYNDRKLDLLEGTQWKMVLNIGREPGTWMPKTWGVSGERLRANLEIEFTSDQLYEREEFLGGVGGAKQCRVIDNSVTLGPSITEGQRFIPTKKGPGAAGGWRIAKGSGPLGTDMLRFYVDIDEEMSHSGSDVYCPKGRIYMQCGFFELNNGSGTFLEFGGRREQLKKQLSEITNKYEELNQEIEEEGFFSINRLMLTRKMVQVSMDARMVNAKLNDARVIEPDKSILTVSKEGDIGLTREGGVVCKVMKGAVIEYHILGRFSLVAMEPKRDEMIEREKVY